MVSKYSKNAGIKPADSLSWAISGLVSANPEAESIAILGGLEISNEEEMSIAINLISESGDSSIRELILKGLAKSSDELTPSVMRNHFSASKHQEESGAETLNKRPRYRGRSTRYLHIIRRCGGAQW